MTDLIFCVAAALAAVVYLAPPLARRVARDDRRSPQA